MGVEDSSSDVAVLHSPSSRWSNSVRLAAESTLLDPGFLDLYNLDFAGAQKNFAAWETQHPDDPVVPSAKLQDIYSPNSSGLARSSPFIDRVCTREE